MRNLHKMVLSHVLEIKPDVVVSGMFKTYYENLRRIHTTSALDYRNSEVREMIS